MGGCAPEEASAPDSRSPATPAQPTAAAPVSPSPASAPAVAGVLPASGSSAGGAWVTVSGSGFRPGAQVRLGGVLASGVSVVSSAQITAVTPAVNPTWWGGPVLVSVTNPDLQSGLLPGGFRYVAKPALWSVSPAWGFPQGGSTVTLSGAAFATGAVVSFGGVPGVAATFLSSTAIVATTPPSPGGAVAVAVVNPDGQAASLPTGFAYGTPPSIATTVPPSGCGGTLVTVYGNGFAPGTTVAVGTLAAGSVNVVTAAQVEAIAYSGTLGAQSVTVTDALGIPAVQPHGFTVVPPPLWGPLGRMAPAIHTVLPSTGPGGGGNVVTIAGDWFQAAGAKVFFGPVAATSVQVVSSCLITAVAPGGVDGTRVHVAVVNADGNSVTSRLAYGHDRPGTPPSFLGLSSATPIAPHGVELRWSPGSDDVSPTGALRYAIYASAVSRGHDYSAPVAVTPAGATVYTVTSGLSAATTAYFVVRARDEVGGEDGNTIEVGARLPVPAAAAWRTTGSLAAARDGHTATLLPDGRVLAAGGESAGNPLASSEIYDPGVGGWSTTGSLSRARRGHTAILLDTGRLLVAGGTSRSLAISEAEIFDPGLGVWTLTGSLGTARSRHTATLLYTGRVLVAGGDGGAGPLSGCELYDPASGSWSTTGSLVTGSTADHTATLLGDGRVLLAGGTSTTAGNAELYDPVSGTWSATGEMRIARCRHSATLLPDGRVLVAGGDRSGALASAEVYDPRIGTWMAVGTLASAREGHAATRLPAGLVLVAGGDDGSGSGLPTEVYLPGSATWITLAAATAPRRSFPLVLLPSGAALAVGGCGASSVRSCETLLASSGLWPCRALPGIYGSGVATTLSDGRIFFRGPGHPVLQTDSFVYDPKVGVSVPAGSPLVLWGASAATALADGKVLVAGGAALATGQLTTSPTTASWLFDPKTWSWTVTGSLLGARVSPASGSLRDGRVLVAGGWLPCQPLATAEIYDPATGTWTATGSLGIARCGAPTLLLHDGRVLAIGGEVGFPSNPTATAELYDPATGTWTSAGSMSTGRRGLSPVLLPSGRVLVVGGMYFGGPFDPEMFDPSTGTWSAAGTMSVRRSMAGATLLPSGRVLVSGGNTATWADTAACEIYDPETGAWSLTAPLATPRSGHHTMTRPDGSVLVLGGRAIVGGSSVVNVATAEVFEEAPGATGARRPFVATVAGSSAFPVPLAPGSVVTLTGSGFRGDSEASAGGTAGSAADTPVLHLEGPLGGGSVPGGGLRITLTGSGFAGGGSLSFTVPSSGAIPRGHYFLRVTVNGIPSEARIVRLP
ncbi:MAG: IPT/TIG domain-containing protein [Planctomycetales bacterium]|nr:IPT/TIG domain-containing protein [Planctomycetales bacterium]